MAGFWVVTGFLGAALVSFTGVGATTEFSRRTGMLSHPGARSSHVHPTPTGGGMGIVIAIVMLPLMPGFFGQVAWPWTKVVVPCLALLGIVGWLDDRRGLSPVIRLLVQLAVSSGLIWSLAGMEFAAEVGQGRLALFATGCVVALVWIMNAYNFMDGSNGMAGAQGIFSGLLLGGLLLHAQSPGLAVAGFIVAGGCAGFLPWNFPRAKVFMGDTGSVPLGFALGALMVIAVVAGKLSLPVALLVLGVFLTDSSLTLLRRIFAGERWYTAHKQHAYQRLIAAGWSHNQVLALYQAVNLTLIMPGAVLGTIYPKWAWPLAGTVYLIMAAAWLIQSLKPGVILERQ